MGDEAISAPEDVRLLGVALEDQFDVVAINLHVGDCTRLVYTEGAIDRGGVDDEGRHGLRRELGGVGAVCPRCSLSYHIRWRSCDSVPTGRGAWCSPC